MPPCFPLQRKVNTLGLHLQYHPAFFYLCFYLHPSNLSFKICLAKSVFHCFSQQLQFLLHPIFIITDFYYIRFLLQLIFITTGVLPRRGCFSLTPRWLRREATGSLRGGETGAAQLGRRPCRSPYNIVISGSTETWSPTKQYRTGLSPRRTAPAVAVTAHRGVNEKQPLRGNKSDVMTEQSVLRGEVFLIKSM